MNIENNIGNIVFIDITLCLVVVILIKYIPMADKDNNNPICFVNVKDDNNNNKNIKLFNLIFFIAILNVAKNNEDNKGSTYIPDNSKWKKYNKHIENKNKINVFISFFLKNPNVADDKHANIKNIWLCSIVFSLQPNIFNI